MERWVGSTGAWAKETVSSTKHPNRADQRDDADIDPGGYDDCDETPPDTEEDCGCEDFGDE
jgi:hypothetical protein